MTSEGFEKELAALQADDPDAFEGHWRRAAEWFHRAFRRGVEITPAIALLEELFQDSHQVPAMEAIAKVLVAYHLTHKSLDRLRPLIRTVVYGDTVILKALHEHAGNRAKFEQMLPLVSQVMSFSTMFQVFAILDRHVGRSSARLARIARLLAGHPASRDRVSDYLKEAVIAGRHRQVDFSQAMPVLAEVLADPLLKGRAAGSLIWIAEADIPLGALVPVLETLVTDPDQEVRRAATYALAYHRLSAKDWRKLDSLWTSPDFVHRRQAVHAMGVTLIAHKRWSGEVIVRLAAGLLDREAEIRKSCLELLSLAKAAFELPVDPATLDRLVGALADSERGDAIAEFLYYFAEKSPAAVDALEERLAAAGTGERARRLADRCREIRAAGRRTSCDICRFIPRRNYFSHPADAEKVLQRLAPTLPVEDSADRTCPGCGGYYRYSYSEEWQSPTDGMGIDYEITLQRLTPPELRRLLPPEKLAGQLPDYEAALARCRADLTHPERYLREDAAHALILDALERPDPAAVSGLLGHEDAAVRLTSLATWHAEWSRDPAAVPVEPVVRALRRLKGDTDSQTRLRAAEALCAHYGAKGDLDRLHRFLTRGNAEIKSKVIDLLRSRPELDGTSFRLTLQRLAWSRDECVRHRAQAWLVEQARRGLDPGEVLPVFVGRLASENGTWRKEAAAAMAELAWTETPEAPRILELLVAALPAGEARYYAYKALDKAALGGFDISPAFPSLLRVAGNRKDTSGYRATALSTLEKALPEAARRGSLDGETLRGLAGLLEDPNEEIRRVAAECFKKLIGGRVGLEPVREAFLKMLTRLRVTYIESYFASDVAGWMVKRRDWDGLERLLGASSEVSGAASRVLAKVASEGLDLSPVLDVLLQCLVSSSWYSRDGAAAALAAQARRHPEQAPALRQRLSGLNPDRQSGEILKLLAAVGDEDATS